MGTHIYRKTTGTTMKIALQLSHADRSSKPQLRPDILILFSNYFVIILSLYTWQRHNSRRKHENDMERECRKLLWLWSNGLLPIRCVNALTVQDFQNRRSQCWITWAIFQDTWILVSFKVIIKGFLTHRAAAFSQILFQIIFVGR